MNNLRHMLQTSMAIIDHLGSNTTMICPPTSTTQIGRNIPARKWGNQQPQHQQVYVPPQQRQQPQPTATSGDSNMEAMMKMMADMMKGQLQVGIP